MLPSQVTEGRPAASPEGNLEDRLRGLILNNTASNIPPSSSAPAPAKQSLPPHLMMATLEDQQAYLARPVATPQLEPPQDPLRGQQQPTGRKKLNQAQRRQMNSQLSIPIDTRPQQPIQPGRGYGNAQQSWSPRYNNNLQPQHHQRFSQQLPHSQQSGSPYTSHDMYHQGPQPSHRGRYQQGNTHFHSRQGQQYPQQRQPAAFNPSGGYDHPQSQDRHLYQPGAIGHGRNAPLIRDPNDFAAQSNYLEILCREHVPKAGIETKEEAEKEAFRIVVEKACRDAITEYERHELANSKFDPLSVELKCFGSMSSGFAIKSSDMDLALLAPHSKPPPDSPESCIPRILEKKLLGAGYGARLLTRTRVPIIKLCEKPTEKLRADLIEERTKWEIGFAEGGGGVTDTPEVDALADDEGLADVKPVTNQRSTPTDTPKQAVSHRDHDDLAQLGQKETQPLADYYNTAKRVLRKMGVFDLTVSSPHHDLHQSRILNSVCRAFISGLSSEPLSMRLRRYKSISPLFSEPPTIIQRSLSGILTQIEGERLAMAYESRSLTEADEKREAQCFGLVEAWRQLQDQFELTDDPLVYNRKLYMAFERLKNMSSLALVFLEELQHEQVSYYAARAHRLMDDLRQRVLVDTNTLTSIIIARYVSGVRNPQIREDLQRLTLDANNFEDVVLQHRALQLAVDFEHALKIDLYAVEDRSYVNQYVNFLRSRKAGSESQSIDIGLLAAIRRLPDPTKVSQNNPRDRYKDHLEFPKTDIGIQCDINFSAQLALHNTLLLRCYSHSDSRVRLLILFIKNWAKVRAINTPYRGTLSSYGYVLMVLHYLVNIAYPFVCPNLQELRKDPPSYLPPAEIEAQTTCEGRDVRFWRNEVEIKDLASRGLLNQNKDSVGFLLRGFFEYFAQTTQMSTIQRRGFDWGREVLSLRTLGGILTKQEKGWTGAKTVFEKTTVAAPPTVSTPAMETDSTKDPEAVVDGEVKGKATKLPPKTIEETKEIRHRYLFAIEDPFELDHNVARTVTHNGIVSIRDEFRRAWRIIRGVGRGSGSESEGLLDPASNDSDIKSDFAELLHLIHGADADTKMGPT
ncbi:Terminal uridylyltransferase cid1 [Hyphodiscus hymeniophilus]|uniref:polynucleotide adenylyltransferase n=1 Tax=Hyphodiscus hymeniophilus TaxID=353542 RepID=A0A9P7AZ09_9HELO|nr:Terminal uridylyltransferase cid1 [Hyphodiscus hymeniophilus]